MRGKFVMSYISSIVYILICIGSLMYIGDTIFGKIVKVTIWMVLPMFIFYNFKPVCIFDEKKITMHFLGKNTNYSWSDLVKYEKFKLFFLFDERFCTFKDGFTLWLIDIFWKDFKKNISVLDVILEKRNKQK